MRTLVLAFLVLGFGCLALADGLLGPASTLDQPNTVSLAFSPDGSVLALARGNDVRMLRCEDWGEATRLGGHTKPVSCVAFSAVGSILVSSSWDGTVRLWDSATGEMSRVITVSRGASSLLAVAINPDGRTLALGALESGTGFAMVMWYDSATGRLVRSRIISLSTQTGVLGGGKTTLVNYVRSVRFSPDGSLVAAAFTDKAVRVWDARGEQLIATLADHSGSVNAVAFSPNGKHLAAATWRETVIWDVSSGKKLRALTGHRNEVRAVAYSPDGLVIATGGYDGVLRLWDAGSGDLVESVQVLRPKTGMGATGDQGLLAIAFSPDGRTLAAAGSDGRVYVWKVRAG